MKGDLELLTFLSPAEITSVRYHTHPAYVTAQVKPGLSMCREARYPLSCTSKPRLSFGDRVSHCGPRLNCYSHLELLDYDVCYHT